MAFTFDVAISFAGEDRHIARDIAAAMRNRSIHVLFDEFYEEHFARPNLHEFLRALYEQSRVCVVIVSQLYLQSPWSQAEIHLLVSRAKSDNDYTLVPVQVSGVDLPLTLKAMSSIDYTQSSADFVAEIVDNILQKKSPIKKQNEISSFHIFQRESKWSVRRQGAARASSLHKTQADALRAARALAAKNNPSEIIIHSKDGSIVSREAYKAGE